MQLVTLYHASMELMESTVLTLYHGTDIHVQLQNIRSELYLGEGEEKNTTSGAWKIIHSVFKSVYDNRILQYFWQH